MEHGRAERAPLSTGCDDAPQPCHVRGRIYRWRTYLRLSFHLPVYLICSDQLISVDQTVLMSSTSAAARGQLWLLAHLAMPSLLLPLVTWRCSQAVFTMVSSGLCFSFCLGSIQVFKLSNTNCVSPFHSSCFPQAHTPTSWTYTVTP